MTYSIAQFFLLGALTMVFVGLITAPIRKLALRVGAVDAPTLARKTQKEPIPYLGGVAIAVGIVGASYGSLLAVDFTLENFELASFVLIPAIAISAMGLWDDLKGLEPWPRLVAQTATGIIVAVILTATDTMGFAFDSQLLNYAITVLWIVGVCNSINFFDNHDGGAAGTVTVITFFLFFIAYDRQQVLVSALAIVTAGATAGFLLWNRHPAKIYMGDAGSLFLGIIISVLTIRLSPGVVPTYKSLAIPLFLMATPILDTTVAVISRIARGISPFQGGRDHLSHRLMRKGLNRRITAFTLWGLAAVYGAIALGIYIWPDTWGTQLIIVGAAMWLAKLVFFLRIPSEG
ncbi:Rfe UDP-N-acetylmuramyl pentapeptide phosphotransferase/UDP-N- acetylglucosamine-1-phosphate transferase [Candidatus Nanopelagicaceae bacterium]|jgi:UDP-GlcNAc:undecaprenyl-phosphate/decaprenyl-phosphate GlcNAc-1-phosphate transferase